MSHRREQLASSLQKVVGQLITEGFNDPRIRGLISVTAVELSPDGHYATVSVSVLPATAEKLSVQGLRSAAGFIRAEIGRRLRMRVVPIIQFQPDASLKKQAEVLDVIRKAVGDAAPPADGVTHVGEPPPPNPEERAP